MGFLCSQVFLKHTKNTGFEYRARLYRAYPYLANAEVGLLYVLLIDPTSFSLTYLQH